MSYFTEGSLGGAKFATACVLSFNRPKLLLDTLETVTRSGYPMELLIHDDGSDDPEVAEILADAVNVYGATVIRNPPGHNQGQGVALNRMFGMAKGDPIVKVDHDLLFEPGWLGATVDLLRKNPAVGLLGLLHYYHDPVDSRKTILPEQAQGNGVTYHSHILGSAFAVRRHVYNVLGPFSEHSPAFAEDALFQYRVRDSEEWFNALPEHDLCTNVGMGYGPSTVNVAPGKIQDIHTQPFLLNPSFAP